MNFYASEETRTQKAECSGEISGFNFSSATKSQSVVSAENEMKSVNYIQNVAKKDNYLSYT